MGGSINIKRKDILVDFVGRILVVALMAGLAVFLVTDAHHWVHLAHTVGASPVVHHETLAGKVTLF